MSLPVDVKFDIMKEDWNVYELSDGTILRTKFVLIKVARGVDASGNIGYNFNSTNHVAAFTPNDKKGTPSTIRYSPNELQSSIVEDVDFDAKKENWNVYDLEDKSRISVKLILTRVAKTDKCDPAGSPIYLTQTQTVIKPKLAKEFQKKVISTMRSKGPKSKTTSYQV